MAGIKSEGKKIGKRDNGEKRVELLLCWSLNFKVGEFLNSDVISSLRAEAQYIRCKFGHFFGIYGMLRFNIANIE